MYFLGIMTWNLAISHSVSVKFDVLIFISNFNKIGGHYFCFVWQLISAYFPIIKLFMISRHCAYHSALCSLVWCNTLNYGPGECEGTGFGHRGVGNYATFFNFFKYPGYCSELPAWNSWHECAEDTWNSHPVKWSSKKMWLSVSLCKTNLVKIILTFRI